MRTAIPALELPVRSALTVAANCVNRTRKHAASVTAYSVLRACPSIQCSTRSLHQQTTGNVESEKGLKGNVPLLGILVLAIQRKSNRGKVETISQHIFQGFCAQDRNRADCETSRSRRAKQAPTAEGLQHAGFQQRATAVCMPRAGELLRPWPEALQRRIQNLRISREVLQYVQ